MKLSIPRQNSFNWSINNISQEFNISLIGFSLVTCGAIIFAITLPLIPIAYAFLLYLAIGITVIAWENTEFSIMALIISWFLPYSFSIPPIRRILISDFLIVLLILKVTYKITTLQYRIQRTPFDKPLLFFILSTGISAIFAQNRVYALLGFIQFVELVSVFYIITILVRNQQLIKRIANLYLVIVVGQGCLTIYQFFVQGKLRPTGTIGSDIGLHLGMACLAFVIMFLYSSIHKKIVYGTLGALTGFSLMLTLTRGIWLALAGAFIILAIRYIRIQQIFGLVIAIFLILSVLIFMFSNIYYIFPESVSERMASIYDIVVKHDITSGQNWTVLSRFMGWRIAWNMFLGKPIFGVGPKGYAFAMPVYNPGFEIYGAIKAFEESKVASPHNQYFEILAEQGIIGILTLLFLIVVSVRTAHKAQKSATTKFGIPFTLWVEGSLFICLLMGFSASFLRANDGKILTVLLGLIAISNRVTSTNVRRSNEKRLV